jgi:hypothetical protein
MWGTTSFCDELIDDFGGAFEATSIDGCRLFCRLAKILPHGVLGLLQHNHPDTGSDGWNRTRSGNPTHRGEYLVECAAVRLRL